MRRLSTFRQPRMLSRLRFETRRGRAPSALPLLLFAALPLSTPVPVFDGTGYYVTGRVYTNRTAQHALTQLRETAVFFVFGHGGDVGKACQTF